MIGLMDAKVDLRIYWSHKDDVHDEVHSIMNLLKRRCITGSEPDNIYIASSQFK